MRSLQGGEHRLTKLGKGFFRDKYYKHLVHVPVERGRGLRWLSVNELGGAMTRHPAHLTEEQAAQRVRQQVEASLDRAPFCSSRTRPTGWSAPRARTTGTPGPRWRCFQPCDKDVLQSAFKDKPLCVPRQLAELLQLGVEDRSRATGFKRPLAMPPCLALPRDSRRASTARPWTRTSCCTSCSQTAILQQLAAARAHSSDPLSVLLAGGAPDGEDYPKSSSVKGFAARQVLMDNFRRHPDRVLQSVWERLAQARRRPSAASLEARDLWYHFQESVPFGSHKTLTHVGFLAAKMWECSKRDEIPQLRALVGLLAVFVEQAAFDNGGLRLAHLLTCAEDPPGSQTELHRAPRSEHACAQLADPKWVATQLAYLRDVETMQEKSNKFSTRPSALEMDQDSFQSFCPLVVFLLACSKLFWEAGLL